ncbi:receptor-type tyrosine-protein phosphatase kappa isoform X2 [Patella vulgata]|uniref:receptor-type tyrosine-protein phosphatase kappa isoform X2 n=1 Tax=Patella vulgata TaxID=6465 RepID=UPI0021809B35|nr:receptor-type tyrosine-protein phosphatase kappa isoform X2 [Patella vulgata]
MRTKMKFNQLSAVAMIMISSLIDYCLALDECRDTINTNCQSCGNTVYPIDEFYRENCMKSCGVCTGTNIALGKPTRQSSRYYNSKSSNAVDGNTDNKWENGHCSHTNNTGNEWWCVDLQQIYDIDNIKLFNRVGYENRLQGFEIKTSSSGTCNQTGFRSATSCYIDTTTTTQDIYTIDICNQTTSTSVSARTLYVNVSSQPLTLCEVQIFSAKPTNVALGQQSVQQNSTNNGGIASRAVDGNTDSDYDNGKSCTHTTEGQSGWWCVDLQQLYYFNQIKIYNRKNTTWWGRLKEFQIKISSSGQCNQTGFTSATSCYKDTTPTIQSVYNVTGCNQGSSTSFTGRTVYVSSLKESLTLCEVEIFAVPTVQCNTGYYSTSSSTCKPCNTCFNNTCDPITGACTGDCKTGFYGGSCQQNCSDGCLNNQCSKSDGRCSKCIMGRYDEGCNVSCSTECNGGCDRDDGKQTGSYTTIIAVVVSIVVLVIIATVVIVLVLKRRRRQKSTESDQVEVNDIPLHASTGVSRRLEKNLKVKEKTNKSGNTYINQLRSSNKLEVDEQSTQVYENVDEPSELSTRVTLTDLLQYIKTRREALESEFQSLPSGLCSAYDYCMNSVNKPKNRYKNICAFNHSRVKLDIENDDPNSDYINACYITGYANTENKYIASQGPVDVIIKEFLRLLWVSQTGKIVMLTNLVEMGKKKCFKYWPDSGEEMKFGQISMTLVNEDNFSHFTIRTLKITKDECGSRTIKQYHYTSWPDKGVPTDVASLVEFRSKVIKAVSPHPGPMVVHCSAGIGRTGTFLGLDYLIEEARAEGSVDIYECVKQMRYERVNMVQNWEQYAFLHDALATWYIAGDITFPVTSYQQDYQTLLKVNSSSDKSQLQERFEMLSDVCPPQEETDCSVALSEENQNKNRDLSILASDKTRIFLLNPNTTDYINAVFISSYKKKDAYILTQTPLPNTVIDFWTMVVDQDVTTIVNMDITETGKDIGQYIPATDELRCGPYNIIKQHETEHENGIYSVVTCLINSEVDDNLQRTIKIYQCNFWNPKKGVPTSAGPIFTLLEDIKAWSQENEDGRMIVHCLNGVEKSGVFCVLAAILERLTIEQDVSILQNLVQIRVSRPQIITSFEQLKFCFDAVGEYLDEFAVYANSC